MFISFLLINSTEMYNNQAVIIIFQRIREITSYKPTANKMYLFLSNKIRIKHSNLTIDLEQRLFSQLLTAKIGNKAALKYKKINIGQILKFFSFLFYEREEDSF
jgi:hypothetical protein